MLSGSGFAVTLSDSGLPGTLEEGDDAVGSFDASERLITTSPSLLVLLSDISKSRSTDTFAMRFDMNGPVKSPGARPNPKNTKVEM